ncbi:hypothetical protein D7Y13_10980 [Corallococcus praedator]|uniref:Lipoprotein n=2 Tax=Myxococcaceae TaxID=31 RepID=A0ABX9QKK7_9BACT|nr:hypothetical protein D7X74_22050 [Corallococcus sp. CA047B]RKH33162.1 hypothetical protein D7X75_13120 [Corallococcus sp. CA031C]RKI11565.1 hypothetical protein D7Y13_10980 [Corallococcus praedator]
MPSFLSEGRRIMRTALLVAAVASLSGCYDDPTIVYGRSLEDLTFVVTDPLMGVYPNTSVLDDPYNPFRLSGVGTETKWDIQSGASPVAGFYSWATILAQGPYGEAQYYVGVQLAAIYQRGLADQASLPQTREMAVKAFQSVLDNFPDAVTYDASGTIAYDLVTPAYKGVVELGGTVTGGWVMVKTSSGADRAVKP